MTNSSYFDLVGAAREEMLQDGFQPDFAPGTDDEVAALRHRSLPSSQEGVRDLRNLLWSSLDNDSSRDLDQIEVAERDSRAGRHR